jgi:hypothetical protein
MEEAKQQERGVVSPMSRFKSIKTIKTSPNKESPKNQSKKDNSPQKESSLKNIELVTNKIPTRMMS